MAPTLMAWLHGRINGGGEIKIIYAAGHLEADGELEKARCGR